MRILENIAQLATCRAEGGQGEIHAIADAALVWDGETIVWAGARRGLPAWMALAALAGAVGAIVPAAKALRRRRRHLRAAEGDVTAAWAEIVDRLADLGTPPPPDRTPVEFATDTSPQLLPLARAYSAAVYGNHPAGDSSTHLGVAERWVDEEFAYRNRVAAAFNPRSLLKR